MHRTHALASTIMFLCLACGSDPTNLSAETCQTVRATRACPDCEDHHQPDAGGSAFIQQTTTGCETASDELVEQSEGASASGE